MILVWLITSYPLPFIPGPRSCQAEPLSGQFPSQTPECAPPCNPPTREGRA